jgi:hypothetical protein
MTALEAKSRRDAGATTAERKATAGEEGRTGFEIGNLRFEIKPSHKYAATSKRTFFRG